MRWRREELLEKDRHHQDEVGAGGREQDEYTRQS